MLILAPCGKNGNFLQIVSVFYRQCQKSATPAEMRTNIFVEISQKGFLYEFPTPGNTFP